jgi:hypothetical protein
MPKRAPISDLEFHLQRARRSATSPIASGMGWQLMLTCGYQPCIFSEHCCFRR